MRLPKGFNAIEMEIQGQVIANDVKYHLGLDDLPVAHVIRLPHPEPVNLERRGFKQIDFQFTLLGWQNVDYWSIVGEDVEGDEKRDYDWVIVTSEGFQVWPPNPSDCYSPRVTEDRFMEAVLPFAMRMASGRITHQKYQQWRERCRVECGEVTE